jgi:quercetin dioxygenase-like cupin family protein
MKMRLMAVVFLLLASLFPSSAQSPVPIDKEPHHHLKYANDYFRVFDVVVPSGKTTLFHIHSSDYAFVAIGDASLKAETPGSQPSDLILKDGEARFTKGPITHRVTNPSDTPFRNITVEILGSPGPGSVTSTPDTSPGHSIVLENERVRIERLILEPGQSTNLHTHGLSAMSVFLTKAKVQVESPGQKTQTIEYKPGDFRWRSPITHSIRNIGSTRFEAVGIDLK